MVIYRLSLVESDRLLRSNQMTNIKSSKKPFLSDFDLHLIGEGSYNKLYEKLGAHLCTVDGRSGVQFAVWAPNANKVSVIGDFNDWKTGKDKLVPFKDSGIWTAFVPGIDEGTKYKFAMENNDANFNEQKSDPVAFYSELRPNTASVVFDLDKYKWNDKKWQSVRKEKNSQDAPISIYEVHLGSWMRAPGNEMLSYKDLAEKLVPYVVDLGFTHVELLPVSEHPLDASWGYQQTGYFSATARFGKPDELMYLIDKFHQAGVGVLLDWVPAHFPRDGHGLGRFDGTHLYEHADPRQGEHKEWGTYIFNYGRNEVSNFLISNALFWFDKYHIDGLRVDAVASMLYLDYAREDGEWIPNQFGGRENLAAVDFLRKLNETIYGEHPYAMMVAEESTSWAQVTRPTYLGGLGFGFKWDMGWMNDTLKYIEREPVHRQYHQDNLTFRAIYQFTENFILPLSHDEVVHGKKSILSKMPGDDWQQLANARLLYAYQFTSPGKKLNFMGNEFGQWIEWKFDESLDWHLADFERHAAMQNLFKDLNRIYTNCPALYKFDCTEEGFEWIDCSDHAQSILCYLRKGDKEDKQIAVCLNFTPVPRENYRVGVPKSGYWKEILNTDSTIYGGSGVGNEGGLNTETIEKHGHKQSINLTIPPLAAVIFESE